MLDLLIRLKSERNHPHPFYSKNRGRRKKHREDIVNFTKSCIGVHSSKEVMGFDISFQGQNGIWGYQELRTTITMMTMIGNTHRQESWSNLVAQTSRIKWKDSSWSLPGFAKRLAARYRTKKISLLHSGIIKTETGLLWSPWNLDVPHRPSKR